MTKDGAKGDRDEGLYALSRLNDDVCLGLATGTKMTADAAKQQGE